MVAKNSSRQIFTIFLNSEYDPQSADYYRRLIDRSTSIAVDGGISLFESLERTPDILVGDFDSRPDAPEKFSDKCEVITHSREKNMSDGEIARNLAVERGADEILLCGYADGESIDHQLGNLLLLTNASVKITAVRPGERVWFLHDDTLELVGASGDFVSVVPLDSQITLTVNGLKYDASALIVKRGSTRSLRNQMTGRGARVTVYGSGLVFHIRAG